MNKLANRTQSGENISFTYDTEDQLIKITNENKETYRFEYDASGNMIQESTFDDIVRTYERNQAGWVTRVNRPGNRFSEYKHDPLGRIVEARYYDDTFNRYSYQKGDLVFASNQDSVVIFEHDIMGNIIRETCDKAFVRESI
ncbi:MAG: hypothetical protein IPI66_07570 [Chitinophagaceae bacterium]|nr:hypothetical protein [Chitinophagaceae bacterium]